MSRQTDPWDDWESEDYSRSSKPGTSASGNTAPGNAATGPSSSSNAKLWEVANSSLSFVPSTTASTSTPTPASVYPYQSSSSTNMPPPQAFMPSLKILKRPSATAGGSASGSSSANGDAGKNAKQTLQDRERAYREARSRIFGPLDKGSPGATLSPSVTRSASPSVPASTENSESEEGGSGRRGKDTSANPSGISQRKKRNEAASGGPTSTLLREPINPPTAQKGNSSKGFTRTRRSKTPLSPAAQEFTPSFLKGGSSTSTSIDAQMRKLEV